MRFPRRAWWSVMVGSAALVLAALVLAVGGWSRADFGDADLRVPAQDAGGGPTDRPAAEADAPATETDAPAAQPDVLGAEPGAPTAAEPRAAGPLPMVPVESRRAAGVPDRAPDQSAPVRLEVPALGVAVPVLPVGVDHEGQMEIPASGQQVGWYRHGPAPGDARGSAVLASHVNTRAEGEGALAALGDLAAGDPVTVTLADGQTVDYVVTDRRTVPKVDLDTAELFDRTGPARLAIVTCGGPWIEDLSSYRDNIVVLAEPVGAGDR